MSAFGWLVTTLVLSCLVGVGVAGYVFYKYRLRRYMDSEIMAIMSSRQPEQQEPGRRRSGRGGGAEGNWGRRGWDAAGLVRPAGSTEEAAPIQPTPVLCSDGRGCWFRRNGWRRVDKRQNRWSEGAFPLSSCSWSGDWRGVEGSRELRDREREGEGKMGKGSELWDDSALVNAFDHAVATYKAMHGKNTQAASSEKEESEDVVAAAAAATAGEEPVSTEAADERIERDDSCTDLPCDATETPQQPCGERKTTEQAPLQETDLDKETRVSESKTYSSDVTDADRKDSSNQQTWDYNELLRKYYELEEQSRKVLEQLHQTNYWNYQIPGQSSEYQQQQVPAYSATAPDPHSSTTQSSCCCLNVPLVSVSCCSTGQPSGGSACMPPSGGCSVSLTCDQCPGASTTYPTGATFMQLPTKVSTNDDQVAKAAMMTAEGAMNLMRSTISGNPGSLPRKEAETGKEESTTVGMNQNFDTTGADSDLAVVLNAWYAAGFYTGRYLMQQSMKNF